MLNRYSNSFRYFAMCFLDTCTCVKGIITELIHEFRKGENILDMEAEEDSLLVKTNFAVYRVKAGNSVERIAWLN